MKHEGKSLPGYFKSLVAKLKPKDIVSIDKVEVKHSSGLKLSLKGPVLEVTDCAARRNQIPGSRMPKSKS